MSWVSWRWDNTAWSGRISSHATLIVSCKLSMLQPLSWPSARNLLEREKACYLVMRPPDCCFCWLCCFIIGVAGLSLSLPVWGQNSTHVGSDEACCWLKELSSWVKHWLGPAHHRQWGQHPLTPKGSLQDIAYTLRYNTKMSVKLKKTS